MKSVEVTVLYLSLLRNLTTSLKAVSMISKSLFQAYLLSDLELQCIRECEANFKLCL